MDGQPRSFDAGDQSEPFGPGPPDEFGTVAGQRDDRDLTRGQGLDRGALPERR